MEKQTKPLILIVEDDAVLRRAYQRIAKEFDREAEIRYFGDGAEVVAVLDEIRAFERVLVITDGNMPVMDGPELISTLVRELGQSLQKKVLISGKLGSHLDRLAGLDVEMIEKPIDRSVIPELIRSFIG